jgi:hypothetical protein
MKYIEVGELLDDVVEVLRTVVIPRSTDRYAIGQTWAAVGILENIAARVEERATIGQRERSLLLDWVAAHGQESQAPEAADLPAMRDACRTIIESRFDWTPAEVASLLTTLEAIQASEQPYRRPTYFNRALGG